MVVGLRFRVSGYSGFALLENGSGGVCPSRVFFQGLGIRLEGYGRAHVEEYTTALRTIGDCFPSLGVYTLKQGGSGALHTEHTPNSLTIHPSTPKPSISVPKPFFMSKTSTLSPKNPEMSQ